ncbi:MAG: hypothetical protein ACLGIV_13190 [Actinomycetes bacterium]
MSRMELPRLRARWRRPFAALAWPVRGRPVLAGGVLRQRRWFRSHRVELATAGVTVQPRRPRRLALRVSSGASAVEVDLLRLTVTDGWSRTPEELDALADALDAVAAPVAGALRQQAAFLRGDVPYLSFSPLAPYVGRDGSVIEDIGHALP